MTFNEMNIKDCLCDMYDIRRVVKQAKLFDTSVSSKDFKGSCITVGECVDNVIEQLSEELKRRGQSI